MTKERVKSASGRVVSLHQRRPVAKQRQEIVEITELVDICRLKSEEWMRRTAYAFIVSQRMEADFMRFVWNTPPHPDACRHEACVEMIGESVRRSAL